MLKRLVKAVLARSGYKILRTGGCYSMDGLSTVHSDHFRHAAEFREAYQRGLQASHWVDPEFEWRVHVALWAATTSLRAAGDYVECGVNAGFMSSAIMQRLDWNSQGRRFYLVDTFAGPVLEQYTEEETQRGRRRVAEAAMSRGGYVTDIDRVRENFAEWPGAVILQGAVPAVLPEIPAGPVAFLHLDMNCALPEAAALRHFWPRLSPGAMVLLDDYAYFGYDEQRRAIDGVASELQFEVLSLPTGQGLLMR